MLQKLRQRLTLVLLALLPLHAFLVTTLTKAIAGPDHRPLAWIALWKEGLLAVILLIAVVEIAGKVIRGQKSEVRRWDAIDASIVAFAAVAFGVTAYFSSLTAHHSLLGIKYDLVPLLAFLILRRVGWSEEWKETLIHLLVWIAALVAAYGLLTLILPDWFFARLGYSNLHSLYVPTGPLAAFQFIEGSGIPRVQSVMSGPNQLGLWLLIPFSIIASSYALASGPSAPGFSRVRYPILLLPLALLLTFSRAAWIAAALILGITVFRVVPRGRCAVMAGITAAALASFVLMMFLVAPSILLRGLSTAGHLERPVAALKHIAAHPLGLGLGTAGPASNAVSDACVTTEDPSWAKDHPELCVFVEGKQVQPLDRECHCPMLTENWYLQIGIETGVPGLLIYVMIIVLILWKIFKRGQSSEISSEVWPLASGLCFLGIAVAGLFLHSFEDAAVAYTVWVLLAACYTPGIWQSRPAPSSSSTSADSTRT